MLVLSITLSRISLAEEEFAVSISPDLDINVEQIPAKGKYLILWLAPEYGLREGHRALARLLSQQNLEVWLTNIVESLFLPQGTASLKKFNGSVKLADV